MHVKVCQGPKDKLKDHLCLCCTTAGKFDCPVFFQKTSCPSSTSHELLQLSWETWQTIKVLHNIKPFFNQSCHQGNYIFHVQVLAILNVILSGVDELRWLNFWISLIISFIFNLNSCFQNYMLHLWGDRKNRNRIMRYTFLLTMNSFIAEFTSKPH